jgi:hypothetical protein
VVAVFDGNQGKWQGEGFDGFIKENGRECHMGDQRNKQKQTKGNIHVIAMVLASRANKTLLRGIVLYSASVGCTFLLTRD